MVTSAASICMHHEAFVINPFLTYTVHAKSAYMNSHAWRPQGLMVNKLSIVAIRNIQGICLVDLVVLHQYMYVVMVMV